MDYLPLCSDIDFMPHGHCYFWQPEILYPHVIGDVLTALAYFVIPFYLVYVIRKRKEEVPRLIFFAFALFILVCGFGHLLAAISIYIPMYRTEAVVKILMAIVSLGTVGLVLYNHKKLLAFPTPFQLAKVNQQLAKEVARRKKAENELSKREEFLRLTIANAPIGMATVSLEGKWLSANQVLCDTLGYSEQELLKFDFQSITHPNDLDKDLRLVQQMLEGKIATYEMEKRYLHKAGHYVYGSLSVSLMRDAQQQPLHFIAQIIDISERKQTEIKLRRSEKLFKQVIKYAPIGYALLNKDLKWVQINKALCNILGYRREEILNKEIADLIYPPDKEIGAEDMVKLMKKEIPSARVEKRHIRKDGSLVWIALNATIIWDKKKFLYLLIQWADITLLKNKEEKITRFNVLLEKKVKERTNELEEANKELENFAYVLTHDLRQPLKNMSNLSGLIMEEYTEILDSDGQYMLRLLESNTNKVDRLIVDMMNYTKSNKSTLNKSAVAIKELFELAFQENAKLYPNKKIDFSIQDLPVVLGDQAALTQVCQNLVSNALKYSSKQTHIKIWVDCQKQANQVVFSVRDNGIGFDEAFSHKIFEVFQRIHQGSDFEGTGMGMAITAKIVEKHGGRIWAKGAVGEGATFYFSLPTISVNEVVLN